jgi:DNA-binding HxlR family transcriptional regulator
VVRELLEGARRYGELLDGLPGIATNLLAERLRGLEEAGVLARDPVDGRYALTRWGEGLRDVVYALGRWASPLMTRPLGDDEYRSHWLRHMVAALFDGVDPLRKPVSVEIRCGDQPMTLVSRDGSVDLVRGPSRSPDVVLTGPPDVVSGLLAGRLSRSDAEARGVSVVGPVSRLGYLRPRRPPSSPVERDA